MVTLAALAAAGLIAGVLGAIMGLGGGIFLVPMLTFFFDFPIRAAVGTSLVAVIATSAGVAAIAPHGRGADVALGLRLEVATAAGAIGGGLAAGLITPQFLHIIFAGVVFFTAGYTFFKSRRKAGGPAMDAMFAKDYRPVNWAAGLSAAGGAGMLSGLLGVGGGFIKVPVMYAIMEVPLGIATATSNFMVGITAAASVFVYYGRGDIYPLVVIPTSIGVFAGAMIGAYALAGLRASWVRSALIGLLVLTGIQMLMAGIHHG